MEEIFLQNELMFDFTEELTNILEFLDNLQKKVISYSDYLLDRKHNNEFCKNVSNTNGKILKMSITEMWYFVATIRRLREAFHQLFAQVTVKLLKNIKNNMIFS